MNRTKYIDQDESSLWKEFRRTGDAALKQVLIETYIGVAKLHAASIYKLRYNNAIEYSDYYHFAIIGLIEAISSYKYDLNDYFPAYAKHRVRGAIFDGLAGMTEKASQSTQTQLYQHRLISFLEQDEKDDSDSAELFDEMVSLSISLSISAILDTSESHSARLTDYGNHEIAELKELLKMCVDKLSRDERLVINYHYFHDVDFVVIAELMELTKGRVSQIHKNAITHIRQFYENELQLDALF